MFRSLLGVCAASTCFGLCCASLIAVFVSSWYAPWVPVCPCFLLLWGQQPCWIRAYHHDLILNWLRLQDALAIEERFLLVDQLDFSELWSHLGGGAAGFGGGCFPDGSAVKNLPAMPQMREMWVGSLGQKDPLEEEVATQYNILAWEIPRREEPGGPESTGSQRVGWGRVRARAHTHV